MNKKQILTKYNQHNAITRIFAIALLFFVCFSLATTTGIAPVFASGAGGGAGGAAIDTTAIDTVMDTIIDIIGTAALYIGIVIALWGVFQIVMALRREDSEGIGKQITTVVVGGVLIGFGAFADSIYQSLKTSE